MSENAPTEVADSSHVASPNSSGRGSQADRVAQVVDFLEEKIFSGQYQPGDLLPAERDLSSDLGVSRSVVREALGKLDSLGLVTRRQGSGTRVAEPSKAPVLKGYQRLFRLGNIDLNHLTEARLPLEIAMVRRAAERRTDEHVRQLEEQQAILNDESSDVETHLAADEKFHALLADASGNAMFSMLLEPIQYLRHEPYRQRYDEYQLHNTQDEHQAILDAIRNGDADGAETAMRGHLQKFIPISDGSRQGGTA